MPVIKREEKDFMDSHFKSTRAIVENIGTIDLERLERSLVSSQSLDTPFRDQAKLAWESLAWYKFFSVPLDKKLEGKLWDKIIKDESSLYLAAVYLLVKPNEDARKKLGSLNGPIGIKYAEYCSHYSLISKSVEFDIGEAFGLTAHSSPVFT
jgi:hypothetical protein